MTYKGTGDAQSLESGMAWYVVGADQNISTVPNIVVPNFAIQPNYTTGLMDDLRAPIMGREDLAKNLKT